MGQFTKSHKSNALITVLLEKRDLFRIGSAGDLTGNQWPEFANLLPLKYSLGDGLEQVTLLVLPSLLHKGCNDEIGAA